MRIVLTGGGTGGHLFPIIAVAKKMREMVPEGETLDFLFLGPDGELEKEVMAKEMIESRKILSGKLRRYFSPIYLVDIIKIPLGVLQALWHLLVFMPDAVFSKGGYAGVPVVIAAWLYRIPVIIHESDTTPGLANQFTSRLAEKVAVAFPGASNFFNPGKVIVTGNPIRKELLKGNADEARKIFGLPPEKKTILVMGGSQGARVLNEALIRVLPTLLKNFSIIHLTGKLEYENVIREAGRLGIKADREGYFPRPFLNEEIGHVIAAADLVISRAGANAISEIAANGKPSIIVPIKSSANNHQQLNAFPLSEAGAAIVLDQENLGENILLEKIEEIMGSSDLRLEMSERIKKFYYPDAAEKIAGETIKLAKQ